MVTLSDLRAALLHSWGADTCYPSELEVWSPDNPARDQCGMTALVVQDILGGDLMLGDVQIEGEWTGHHYWNVLPDGTKADLTADQFRPEERVVGGEVVVRPPGVQVRHQDRYELLLRRVRSRLNLD